LEYAWDNNIVVLCYPSHSTHVYQSLDIIIFSVLKRAWSDEQDKFEVGLLMYFTVFYKYCCVDSSSLSCLATADAYKH
ncbi:hypothetical protein L208DRAFT_1267098, partial [Tricholoma matsutake]